MTSRLPSTLFVPRICLFGEGSFEVSEIGAIHRQGYAGVSMSPGISQVYPRLESTLGGFREKQFRLMIRVLSRRTPIPATSVAWSRLRILTSNSTEYLVLWCIIYYFCRFQVRSDYLILKCSNKLKLVSMLHTTRRQKLFQRQSTFSSGMSAALPWECWVEDGDHI